MLVNLFSRLGEGRGLLGCVSAACGQTMNPPSETREGVTVNKQVVAGCQQGGAGYNCDVTPSHDGPEGSGVGCRGSLETAVTSVMPPRPARVSSTDTDCEVQLSSRGPAHSDNDNNSNSNNNKNCTQ